MRTYSKFETGIKLTNFCKNSFICLLYNMYSLRLLCNIYYIPIYLLITSIN